MNKAKLNRCNNIILSTQYAGLVILECCNFMYAGNLHTSQPSVFESSLIIDDVEPNDS